MMCWNRLWGDDIQDEFDQEEMREFVKTGKDTYAVNGAITLFDLADYLPEMDLIVRALLRWAVT